jgi:diguanylate cyclase (GGDEF)-like protein/PAS domain S-box-containing protein
MVSTFHNPARRLLTAAALTRLARKAAPTRTYARLCLAAAAVTAVLAIWLAAGIGGPWVTQTVSNFGLAIAPLSASVACLLRSRRATGRVRVSWILFGLATLSWGLGQVAWLYLESFVGDEVPFPSLADVGYFSFAPLVAAGLLLLPSNSQTVANRLRTVLDGLMIASSLALVSWVLVLGPLIDAGADSPLALFISLWYPMGDVVVVTIVLFMVVRSRQAGSGPMPLALIGTGLVTFSVSDSGFTYQTITKAYASGAVLDLGWFVGFTLILLAARRPAAQPRPDADDNDTRPLGVLMPYIAVLGALGTSIFEFVKYGKLDQFVSWNRSAIIVLIVGRQLLTLLENRSLTRHLEQRVAARTAELQASEQRFSALVQHSSDVVTVIDADAVVQYQSESVSRVFGYAAADLTGRPLTRLLGAADFTELLHAVRDLAGEPYGIRLLDLNVRHADGHVAQVEMTITNLMDNPSVGGMVINTRDVSERKELEDQLIHEAFHDSLTKLANRALFKDRVEQAMLRRGPAAAPVSPVAVLFLDLDGFKEVNDSLGHAAGDQLLIQVAERLRASVRPEDTVARFGGDEFAVLIEGGDLHRNAGAAEDLARRIVENLEEPLLIESHEIHVQASIGIAVAGPDAGDADQIMRNADLAMYRAKAAGDGGFAQYDPQMHTGLVERLQLEADLRRALESDELVLHYQPTIDLASGKLVGFEALVRWQHPGRGLVSPADFIPVAEATGLIRPLGQLVLLEACRQAAAWAVRHPDQPPITMSVNVSGTQLDPSEDLPAFVAMVLQDSGLPPERLCLEMTESVLMTDTEENLALLRRLKSLGVRIAIDDFGTGYSSLAYLGRFPVDTLKIDRSFVERIGAPTEDAVLAQTIVQLGQSLGMSTVAEGIEQYSQFLALRRMGCTVGQGYYFSRPLPPGEAERLLVRDATPVAA